LLIVDCCGTSTINIPQSTINHQPSKQLIKYLFHRHLNAGEDRRVAQRVLAAFGLAQLHNQVQKILGLIGLEGEDELPVVQPVAVSRVELDGGKLIADADVRVHDFLPPGQRQQVPVARLHEGINEQVFAFSRDDVRARLGGVEVVELVDVHAALGHGQKRVRSREVSAERRLVDQLRLFLKDVRIGADAPEEEIAVG